MRWSGWRQVRAAAPTALVLGVLTALTADARQGGAVSRLERRSLHSPARASPVWKIVTQLGDAPAVALMTAGATLMAAASSRGRWWQPILSVVGGGCVRSVMCRTLQRERPPRQWWLDTPTGSSFPSRHTTWVALGMLSLTRQAPERVQPTVAARRRCRGRSSGGCLRRSGGAAE